MLLGAPSLAGALFLCRETRKLPFDCGSPRTGRGARQRGSEWQRGKGGALPAPASSCVRSPSGAAAAAAAAAAEAAAVAPARHQPRGKRSAPARRAERAQQVAPHEAVGPPASQPLGLVWVGSTERDAEPWSGVGLVDRTEPAAGEWREERSQTDVPPTRQEPNSTPLSGLLRCFGEGGGIIFLSPLGRKILF